MKLDSSYFNKIRVNKSRKAPEPKPARRTCQAEGCDLPGEHKAPKGRQAEGEYYWFCLEHVRAYNKSYNYFSGMDDSSIQSYQKDASVGHRPTWRMGADGNGNQQRPSGRAKYGFTPNPNDPFRLFPEAGAEAPDAAPDRKRRHVRNLERKSLQKLGLDDSATAEEIRARYKTLVKRHHPDANGGDRSLEDRLREIIQAYNYLKSVGFC
jgi:curved DNA-binding protein CbpA